MTERPFPDEDEARIGRRAVRLGKIEKAHGRSVQEWIGATDDAVPPPHVRLRILRTHDNICHLTGLRIQPGDLWDCDHVRALEDGGQNRETNLAPALRWAHRKKTAAENVRRRKADRQAQKHHGIKRKSKGRPLTHPTLKKRFDGTVVPREPRA